MKPAILEAAILEVLADRDTPAPERYMMVALAVDFRIKLTFTELRDTLHKLEETKHIAGVRGRDGHIVWGLCEIGRVRLADLK